MMIDSYCFNNYLQSMEINCGIIPTLHTHYGLIFMSKQFQDQMDNNFA